MVDEFHSILSSLQQASGEELSSFYIPQSMMRARPVSHRRYAKPGKFTDIDTELTSAKYCDKVFFNERMDGLWEHFAEKPKVDRSWQGQDPPDF